MMTKESFRDLLKEVNAIIIATYIIKINFIPTITNNAIQNALALFAIAGIAILLRMAIDYLINNFAKWKKLEHQIAVYVLLLIILGFVVAR